MINFNWDITKFYCKDIDAYSNVVHGIKARRYGQIEGHVFSVLTEVFIDTENIQTFVEFEGLTKEIAETWIETTLGTSNLSALDQDITNELIKLTSQEVLDPPWW